MLVQTCLLVSTISLVLCMHYKVLMFHVGSVESLMTKDLWALRWDHGERQDVMNVSFQVLDDA